MDYQIKRFLINYNLYQSNNILEYLNKKSIFNLLFGQTDMWVKIYEIYKVIVNYTNFRHKKNVFSYIRITQYL